MIDYVIKVMMLQVLFLLLFDLFLSKETFFNKNRVYLLTTFLGSFLIPLITIPIFQKIANEEISILLPEIILSPQKTIEQALVLETSASSWSYIDTAFWIGVSVFFLLFVLKLSKILSLVFKNKIVKNKGYSLVVLPNTSKAFSFFKYIFLGEKVHNKEKVISHELVHLKQFHSFDLLVFEIFKVIMWFNPMTYIFQKRVSLLHEYLSDSVMVKTEKKENYIDKIVSEFFQVENIAFVNQFYKKSLLRKRIVMLTREKSKQIKQLKYLLLIPLLSAMLFYVSCSEEFQVNNLADAGKKLQNRYLQLSNEVKVSVGDKKTLIDFYIGFSEYDSSILTQEITVDDLNAQEKEEYEEEVEKFTKSMDEKSSLLKEFVELKLFRGKDNRAIVAYISNFKKIKSKEIEKENLESENVPFAIVEEVPVFPGCEGTKEEKRKCFIKKTQQHFITNFNADLPNKLNLSPGKKRLIMQFKVDKEGVVTDLFVRAPHPELEKEATRILELLPKMTPGKKDGKNIAVRYTLPLRIDVE